MATRKFTRNEVKTASDTLNARIDTTDGEIKETRDSVDRVNQRVTGVDGRVTDLDSRTTQGLNGLKGDVQSVDQKAGQAQTAADRAAGDVVILDQKFQNRNQFTVAAEKSVQFKFDSAQLDSNFKAVLDDVAEMLEQNPDSIVVLEGRTDSRGDKEYNVKLGERRVESVRRYLAVDKSVPVYKIHQISMGAARPVASNDSRDGREKNRAVTMMILTPRAEGSVAAK
jgi:outer membrane protein OmpA-like peptidoglycan-associated protein